MPGKTPCRFLAIAIWAALAVILAVALPGVTADGDEDQAPPIPEKAELKYPNLGSRLDQLVAGVEDGETTAEDAAAGASMHREESVAVTIYLSGSVDDVVQFLEDFGGDPRNVGEDYIEAYVPVSLLGPVSEQPGVLRVREIMPPQPDFGPITSQGVPAHGSAGWNQAGYSGRDVKVGIIDIGFEGFSGLMGTELPATVQAICYTEVGVFTSNLADCEGEEEGDNHGTAVAEAVMDIAPDASLYIANPTSRADLQAAAEWMASEAVSVINHSVSWFFDGPGDGTSPLSSSPLRTVDRAVANDMIWVNSAGNNAQKTWFGGYSDPDGDGAISFAEPEIEVVRMDVKGGERVVVQLRWEDDWDSASTDLDLYLYNTGTRMFTTVASEDEQSGERGQVPLERISFELDGDSNAFGIVVNHYSGGIPDWIQLMVRDVAEIEHHTGSGSISSPGESHNPGLLAVGAAHYYDTDTIASYSSRGPTPDGRVKPDIVGTACGEGASYEPYSRDDSQCWFAGTSQAAPYVAGMAALVRQRFPAYTPAQVAAYLKDQAAQWETPNPNNTWGHGFAQLPSAQIPETRKEAERAALVALYNATGGPNWTNNANWVSGQPVGRWRGVTTDPSGQVVGLSLPENGLTGEIPSELGSLANLTWLSLNENQLRGNIPSELGGLSGLTGLWLHENQLTGEIPSELGNLSSLTNLVLWGNKLSGEIPPELGRLSSLTVLSLSRNELTGEIPAELVGLTNLEELWLADNQLTGEIPTELRSLANLVELVLWGNELTGEIPSWLGNLANLELLSLSANRLTGEIPPELGNLSDLELLSLSANQLTGTIPTRLGSLSNLEELDFADNQLTGAIPTELGSLANLVELQLADNQLTGEIPVELGSLSNLVKLVLWGNELTGEIPVELGTLANLTSLSLSQNQLTGAIPTELGSLSNLQELNLTRNQLSGEIPPELARLTSLEVLALGGNRLAGTIPTWLGSLANLEGLYLWGNRLTGEIPSQLGSLANLEVLSLSDNQLSGVVPQTLAGLTVLESFIFYNNLGLCAPVDDAFQTWLRGISIVYGSSCAPANSPEDRAVLVQVHSATDGANWTNNTNWLSEEHSIREWYGVTIDANGRVNGLFLGDNQLTGEIPSELGSLVNLRSLFLGDNQLTGEIPSELGNLANLERLRLFNNQLTGEIPGELGRLTNLTLLYLSGNQLTGCVPASLRDVADNDFAQLALSFCTSQDPLLAEYDDNNNGKIDIGEIRTAFSDYIGGGISIDVMREIFSLYIQPQ